MFRFEAEVANPSEARKVIEGAVAREMNRRMDEEGRRMAEDATNYMKADWDLNRPYERRRWPGSRRAATAIDYQVTGAADSLPLTMRYRVLGGDQVVMRIIILNFGRNPSTLRPNGNWPLSGRYNRVNKFKRGQTGLGRPGRLAWPGVEKFPRAVTSKRSTGSGFLEKARDDAVKRLTD